MIKLKLPTHWPPDAKNWLTGKDPHAEKDWRQEEKGTTEDEMVNGITDSTDVSLSKLWELVTDTEAWLAAVLVVTKSRTWLSDWTTNVALVIKNLSANAGRPKRHRVWKIPWRSAWVTHSSILACRVQGRLHSIGSHRVRHNWSNLAHVHLSLMCAIYEFEHIQLPMISSCPSRGETHSTSQISLVSLCICFVVLTLDIKAAF